MILIGLSPFPAVVESTKVNVGIHEPKKCNVILVATSIGKGANQSCIYLEPKWGPLFWLEFRLCFGGLTFKNRGHWGSRYTQLAVVVTDTSWPLTKSPPSCLRFPKAPKLREQYYNLARNDLFILNNGQINTNVRFEVTVLIVVWCRPSNGFAFLGFSVCFFCGKRCHRWTGSMPLSPKSGGGLHGSIFWTEVFLFWTERNWKETGWFWYKYIYIYVYPYVQYVYIYTYIHMKIDIGTSDISVFVCI